MAKGLHSTTYLEEDTHFSYDKAGQSKQTGSETYEVIMLEGDTYKKLVARNEQPLSPAGKAKEEKKLQEEARVGLVPSNLYHRLGGRCIIIHPF